MLYANNNKIQKDYYSKDQQNFQSHFLFLNLEFHKKKMVMVNNKISRDYISD